MEDIEARAADLRGQSDGAARLFHHVLDIQIDSPWLAHMVARDRTRELGQLAERTKAAFQPLVEGAREARLARPGTTAEDVLLALPMMMTALVVDRHSGGTDDPARARRILHQGLFTTAPPERR